MSNQLLAHFLAGMVSAGGKPVILNLNAHTILDDITQPGTATAGVSFATNGQLTFIGNNSPASPDTDEWDSNQPNSDGALYEVAFTVLVSGDAPNSGPAIGVYSALTANRTWTVAITNDTRSGVWTMRVREIANPGGNFAQANMTVIAQVLP